MSRIRHLLSPILGFLASVRLAVPLLVVLGASVAWGTLLESRFNAEYAGLIVYQSWWFHGLLFLLGVNVAFAALSRYPYQVRHLGFLVTHAGILVLLAGAWITSRWGIDGQLSLAPGSASREVVLAGLSLSLADGERRLEVDVPRLGPAPRLPVHGLEAAGYLPWSSLKTEFIASSSPSAAPALRLRLHSAAFDESFWLQAHDAPFLDLGPLRLALHRAPGAGGRALLQVSDAAGKEIKQVPLEELARGPRSLEGVSVRLLRTFARAAVTSAGLRDEGASPNPAVELELREGGKSRREVVFAAFPDFSLVPLGARRLRFRLLHAEDLGDLAAEGKSGNSVEIYPGKPLTARVSARGRELSRFELRPGAPVTLPWMGIQLSLEGSLPAAEKKELAVAAGLAERSPLPPPALEIAWPGGSPLWLQEGDSAEVPPRWRVSFGRKRLELPFSVRLVQFEKATYPGTDTPMKFESRVEVLPEGRAATISMNEPLHLAGYTLYQSSYLEEPGRPTISVLSVNRDPGRTCKYVGALLLVLGIALFAAQRSAWGKGPVEAFFGKFFPF